MFQKDHCALRGKICQTHSVTRKRHQTQQKQAVTQVSNLTHLKHLNTLYAQQRRD